MLYLKKTPINLLSPPVPTPHASHLSAVGITASGDVCVSVRPKKKTPSPMIPLFVLTVLLFSLKVLHT